MNGAARVASAASGASSTISAAGSSVTISVSISGSAARPMPACFQSAGTETMETSIGSQSTARMISAPSAVRSCFMAWIK